MLPLFRSITCIISLFVTTHAFALAQSPVPEVLLPLRVDPYVTTCTQTYPFVLHSWRGLQQAQALYTRYVFDAQLAFLPVCLTPPWFAMHTQYVWREPEGDVSRAFASPKQAVGAERITISEQDHAYVLGQTMFLDYQTPYRVFVHELAHFVAFADEYVLSPRLARQQCHAPGYLNRRARHAPLPFAHLWDVLDSAGMVEHDPVCTAMAKQPWQKINLPQWHFLHYNDVRRIPFVYQYMWQWELGLYQE